MNKKKTGKKYQFSNPSASLTKIGKGGVNHPVVQQKM